MQQEPQLPSISQVPLGSRFAWLERLWIMLNRPALAVLFNLFLALGAYYANLRIQAFCQPVLWATITLVICMLPVIFWPFLARLKPAQTLPFQFLRGVAFMICLYCIVFLEEGNLMFPFAIFTGLGVFAFAPHLFLAQLIAYNLARRHSRNVRRAFLAGIGCSVLVASYFVLDFRAAIPIAQELAAHPKPYDGPHKRSVEWILGMHFKYHTRILLGIDGQRPPLHDPAGVIGYMGVWRQDPLKLQYWEREKVHALVFPESTAAANCRCAPREASSASIF